MYWKFIFEDPVQNFVNSIFFTINQILILTLEMCAESRARFYSGSLL
jgi:hypothetical protein